jgi:hypothetical protein
MLSVQHMWPQRRTTPYHRRATRHTPTIHRLSPCHAMLFWPSRIHRRKGRQSPGSKLKATRPPRACQQPTAEQVTKSPGHILRKPCSPLAAQDFGDQMSPGTAGCGVQGTASNRGSHVSARSTWLWDIVMKKLNHQTPDKRKLRMGLRQPPGQGPIKGETCCSPVSTQAHRPRTFTTHKSFSVNNAHTMAPHLTTC